MARLPPKRRLFVQEYLKDLNAKQAAKRAGYKHPHVEGARLLAFASVQNAVEAAFAKRMERMEITAEKVLQEIARLAFSDVRKVVEGDGTLKDVSTLDDDTAAAIAGIEVVEEFAGRGAEREKIGYTKKVKLWDKTASLTLLAKHLRLIVEHQKVEVTTPEMSDADRLARIAVLQAQIAAMQAKPGGEA